MNREECENQILEKLKEIKALAKKYDKSRERHLFIRISNDYIDCYNEYWGTNTPIGFTAFNEREVIHYDN
jgi:hypothetical protein